MINAVKLLIQIIYSAPLYITAPMYIRFTKYFQKYLVWKIIAIDFHTSFLFLMIEGNYIKIFNDAERV